MNFNVEYFVNLDIIHKKRIKDFNFGQIIKIFVNHALKDAQFVYSPTNCTYCTPNYWKIEN